MKAKICLSQKNASSLHKENNIKRYEQNNTK